MTLKGSERYLRFPIAIALYFATPLRNGDTRILPSLINMLHKRPFVQYVIHFYEATTLLPKSHVICSGQVKLATVTESGEQSILDLKARHHGIRYVREVFKILPSSANVINIEDWINKIPILGRLNGEGIA